MSENELFNVSNQTPIEIALGIDEQGMTTAKKLYEFLELNPKNYSRWVKSNITENNFAEENVDYRAFVINEEWGGQATTDYKLTSHFAKKLSMKGNGEKAEQAREYFTRVEEKAKEIALIKNEVTKDNAEQLQALIKAMSTMAESITTVTKSIANIDNRLTSLETDKKVLNAPKNDNWYSANLDKIVEISNAKGYSVKKVAHLILAHLGKKYNLDKAENLYIKETGKVPSYALDIIDYFPEMQGEATNYLNSMLIEKKKPLFDDFDDISEMFK